MIRNVTRFAPAAKAVHQENYKFIFVFSIQQRRQETIF
jgi:hypothetical protein